MKVKNFLIIGILLFIGCKKIHYYPDKEIKIEPTKLIAHRGGRNLKYRDNTLQGIKAALPHKDGIEADVQISKNESIWLSHSPIVEDCNKSLKCFAETNDNDIINIKLCDNKDISYTNLESVLKFIADSFPQKLICIDLKAWSPCSVNSAGIEGMMDRESEVIINMASKYGLARNLLFETETTSVLNFIKSKKSGAQTYLNSFGDFERAMLIALKANYTGISFKSNFGETLTKEKINLLHKKGLKIIVWNLLDNNEIIGLTEMGVDYIQMDL